MESQTIIDIVCKKRCKEPRSLVDEEPLDNATLFTTGDKELDEALGGGIRTGMVWEVAGQRYPIK